MSKIFCFKLGSADSKVPAIGISGRFTFDSGKEKNDNPVVEVKGIANYHIEETDSQVRGILRGYYDSQNERFVALFVFNKAKTNIAPIVCVFDDISSIGKCDFVDKKGNFFENEESIRTVELFEFQRGSKSRANTTVIECEFERIITSLPPVDRALIDDFWFVKRYWK